MLTLTSTLKPHPQVVATPLDDGEVVLLHLDTQNLFALNETGAWIWSRLGEDETLEEIVVELAQRYDLGDQDGAQVVLELVGALLQAELVAEEGSA